MPKHSVTIAIAMHKSYRAPDDSMYLPLHVGAALNPDVLPGLTQDDSGENISRLNRYLSELTGMYWLWKNNDSAYKGLVHYRRYFATKHMMRWFKGDCFNRILGQEELLEVLRHSNVIVPAKRRYFIETVQSHYAHTLFERQLDVTRGVLQDLDPKSVPYWDRIMNRRSAHLFNMMIMDSKTFDAYCSWLFPILFELMKRLDPDQYDAFHARYPGRISEILLNVWLDENHISYTTMPTMYTEFINWPKKITGFLKAKFTKQRYSASF